MRRDLRLPSAGVVAVAIASGIAFARSGSDASWVESWCWPIGALVVSGVVWWARTWRSDAALGHALQERDPERAQRRLATRSAWSVDASGAAALISRDAAVLFALFGRFDDARAKLAGIEWDHQAPLTRAVGFTAEALLDVLECRDYARARNLLRRAECAATESRERIPEAEQSELYALIAVTDLLMGEMVPVSLQQVELAARSEHVVPKLLANWALGAHYWIDEERERAAGYFAACRELAPHCLLMHRPPQLPSRASSAGSL